MGIASFSPSLFRSVSPGMSVVLAPLQALVALFMPVQAAQANHRLLVRIPVQRLSGTQSVTRQAHRVVHATTDVRPVSRLKVMREFEPGMPRSQAGRMVISGRMSDVCAELDRIVQKETQQS